MHFDKIYNQGSARIFRNNFLEALSKTRPWVIYAIYIPLCAYSLYYSYSVLNFSALFVTALFFIGMFGWTLFEYFTHRYLFHYEATSELGKRLVYIFHGTHHEFPRDKDRLFMPPVPSILFAGVLFALFYGLSWLVAGTGNYSFIFFPGFVIGYILYVSMHYAIHRYPPPKGLKALWRNHHLHHYKYPEHGFGVSSPFWDIVFGTVPKHELKEQEKEKSV